MEPVWVIAAAIVIGATFIAFAIGDLAKKVEKIRGAVSRLNETVDFMRQGVKDRDAHLGLKDSDWD